MYVRFELSLCSNFFELFFPLFSPFAPLVFGPCLSNPNTFGGNFLRSLLVPRIQPGWGHGFDTTYTCQGKREPYFDNKSARKQLSFKWKLTSTMTFLRNPKKEDHSNVTIPIKKRTVNWFWKRLGFPDAFKLVLAVEFTNIKIHE